MMLTIVLIIIIVVLFLLYRSESNKSKQYEISFADNKKKLLAMRKDFISPEHTKEEKKEFLCAQKFDKYIYGTR